MLLLRTSLGGKWVGCWSCKFSSVFFFYVTWCVFTQKNIHKKIYIYVIKATLYNAGSGTDCWVRRSPLGANNGIGEQIFSTRGDEVSFGMKRVFLWCRAPVFPKIKGNMTDVLALVRNYNRCYIKHKTMSITALSWAELKYFQHV